MWNNVVQPSFYGFNQKTASCCYSDIQLVVAPSSSLVFRTLASRSRSCLFECKGRWLVVEFYDWLKMSSISVWQDRRARSNSWNLSDPAAVQGHASGALPSRAVRNVRTMSFSLYLVPEWGIWRLCRSFFREIFISQTLAAPLFACLPQNQSSKTQKCQKGSGLGLGEDDLQWGDQIRPNKTHLSAIK